MTSTIAMLVLAAAVAQSDATIAPTPPHDATADRPTLILITGAPGEDEFGKQFQEWTARWRTAATKAEADLIAIGEDGEKENDDKTALKAALDAQPRKSHAELWIVLIGHGTFDSQRALFNLRGPDLAADELAKWLEPFDRPIAIVNCASSSGPFLPVLSRANRVVITATRSGSEFNFAHYGDYLSRAIAASGSVDTDLDKDGQTSLLEAHLIASRGVDEFYNLDARLATEHALLDDNGDGKGTPPDWFRGIRATKRAADGATLDGLRAHQFHLIRSERERRMPAELRTRRDTLELSIAALRDRKSEMEEKAYYDALEPMLAELAHLYEKAEPAASP